MLDHLRTDLFKFASQFLSSWKYEYLYRIIFTFLFYCAVILFFIGIDCFAQSNIITMNVVSTNKIKGNLQSMRKCSQPDLHVKILNLVANRMNPAVSNIGLDKQACGSCITHIPSSSYSTKKNSLATTRAKQGRSKCNKTVCEESQPFSHKKDCNNQSQFHLLHKELAKKYKRKLSIASRVVSLSIDDTKIGDFTIDLRRQIPNEYVNIKMMNKLKLENVQKSRRIIELQRQIAELHERVVQLSFNIQIGSRMFLNKQNLGCSSINGINSNRNSHPHLSNLQKVWNDLDKQNGIFIGQQIPSNQIRQQNQYDYLLRMLKNQALIIQNRTNNLNERDKALECLLS